MGRGQAGVVAGKGGVVLTLQFSIFLSNFSNLSKTDGYLFAMENIDHLVFISGKLNQGKRSY